MKKQKAKSIFKGFLSLMLVAAMLVGFTTPMMSMEANAVTFSQLNDSSVFLKQNGRTTCTLCAATMMLRRYSMLRGDAGWNTITESALRSTAWIEGTGLKWSFSYSNSSVNSISVGHYTLPGGSANEAKLQAELQNCPEGIVIYNESVPHAVLLTDYTNGVYYCADPLGSVTEGRIPLTSAYKVRIDNVTAYWKVTSPVVPGPTGDGDAHTTHSYTSVVTAPTCENKGYTTHTCSCEDSYVDSYVDALGHNYVGTVSKNATCTEKGTTTYKCSRCTASYTEDDIAALGHDYDDEVITKPTCKEEGLMSHTCSRCADNYTEAIPAKGHNYDNPVWVTTVSATCASEGEQAGYCPDCGDLIKTRSTKALGHEIGKWVVSVQPTCTSAGEEQCYCSRCGEVIDTRAIKALGHDEGTWVVTKKATCIDEGEEVCFCTRCGKAIDERKTDALGHDDGVWKIDFEPTADHDGQMSLYCTRCNCVLESKTFKRHKHVEGYRETVIEPTCTTEGEGGVFCAECGAKFDTYSIPALGHIYSEWYTNKNGTHSKICSRCHDLQIENCHYDAVVTAPTCNDGGYTTYTCADCGHSYISDYVAALGHDWSEWTEDENGQTHSRTCANCGESETEEHNWNDWVYNKDATLCKNGTKTRTCQDCGASETEKSIHTAWLCRIPYTIVLWIGNLLKKALYIVSLDWLLPWLNITPVH